MIPVLSASQIRDADAYTIRSEPIASVDLMERASRAFVTKFNTLSDHGKVIFIFAGPGNNGGDALAIARLLIGTGRHVEVFVVGDPERASEDFKVNYKRLEPLTSIHQIGGEKQIPQVDGRAIVIDGLFGSGLSRPAGGLFASVIAAINASGADVFAIDIPSGLFSDAVSEGESIVKAADTISFQVPKLVFFQPSAHVYVGDWHVVDIGLDRPFIENLQTSYYLTEARDIQLPVRTRFSHKGTAGRVLLVSGSKGKTGATTLSARAAMRSGAGLLFIHAPRCATDILQVTVPEAMVQEDDHEEIITEFHELDSYDAVAVGPGIGTNELTESGLLEALGSASRPLVLDADAINILSRNSSFIDLVPRQSILTPHPGEFRRLVGEWEDDFQKLDLLRSFCSKHQLNVVLKGASSAVCNTHGEIFFNPTGNPGMATAGSGDVLTGIITALLGQGLPAFDALRSGVFVHGMAGDLAREEKNELSLIASDIIEKIPSAIGNTLFYGA